MSRKTYSYSAVAIAAIAGLSFSSADGATAFAQDLIAQDNGAQSETGSEQTSQSEGLAVEVMPLEPSSPDIAFVSNEVVQSLPEPAEIQVIQASSLRDLVTSMDEDAALSEELRCLAGAVYFEARGEPLYGQLAVAEVVINRAQDSRWPASYCGVVYQRAQFSFVRAVKCRRSTRQRQLGAAPKLSPALPMKISGNQMRVTRSTSTRAMFAPSGAAAKRLLRASIRTFSIAEPVFCRRDSSWQTA